MLIVFVCCCHGNAVFALLNCIYLYCSYGNAISCHYWIVFTGRTFFLSLFCLQMLHFENINLIKMSNLHLQNITCCIKNLSQNGRFTILKGTLKNHVYFKQSYKTVFEMWPWLGKHGLMRAKSIFRIWDV